MYVFHGIRKVSATCPFHHITLEHWGNGFGYDAVDGAALIPSNTLTAFNVLKLIYVQYYLQYACSIIKKFFSLAYASLGFAFIRIHWIIFNN